MNNPRVFQLDEPAVLVQVPDCRSKFTRDPFAFLEIRQGPCENDRDREYRCPDKRPDDGIYRD